MHSKPVFSFYTRTDFSLCKGGMIAPYLPQESIPDTFKIACTQCMGGLFHEGVQMPTSDSQKRRRMKKTVTKISTCTLLYTSDSTGLHGLRAPWGQAALQLHSGPIPGAPVPLHPAASQCGHALLPAPQCPQPSPPALPYFPSRERTGTQKMEN